MSSRDVLATGHGYSSMRISRAAAWLAFAMLSGCRLFTRPEPQLDARIRIDKSVLTVSESLLVTVTVINRGDKEALASPPNSYGCEPAFRLRTSGGSDLASPPVFCSLVGYILVRIPPGDSIVIQRQWPPTSASGPLPPGMYQLVSRAFGDGNELVSAPVAFTIAALAVSR